jgi:hypothetical protein
MNNIIGLIFICFSSFLMPVSAKAKTVTVTGPEAKTMEDMLFVLLKDYMQSLRSSVMQDHYGDLVNLVEPNSTWHQMIERCREAKDWAPPYLVGSNIVHFSYPWLSIIFIGKKFEKQKDNVKITHNNNNLYDFIIEGARVRVIFENGSMKLYSFEADGLDRLYGVHLG